MAPQKVYDNADEQYQACRIRLQERYATDAEYREEKRKKALENYYKKKLGQPSNPRGRPRKFETLETPKTLDNPLASPEISE